MNLERNNQRKEKKYGVPTHLPKCTLYLAHAIGIELAANLIYILFG